MPLVQLFRQVYARKQDKRRALFVKVLAVKVERVFKKRKADLEFSAAKGRLAVAGHKALPGAVESCPKPLVALVFGQNAKVACQNLVLVNQAFAAFGLVHAQSKVVFVSVHNADSFFFARRKLNFHIASKKSEFYANFNGFSKIIKAFFRKFIQFFYFWRLKKGKKT